MILRTVEGNRPVQLRSSFMVSNPGYWESGIMSSLGITRWTTGWGPGLRETALRIAAVAGAVRLVSESVGSMVLRTYEGEALDRQPVYDSWQAQLFKNPAPGLSRFDFFADVAASVEATTAAFVWKVKDDTGRIVQLLPLDPDYFQIGGTPYERVVGGWIDGRLVDVSADVIVVRAWSYKPAADGTSTLDLHSQMLDRAQKYADYQGRYFDGDGTVNQVIEGGPQVKEQRDAMIAGWVLNRRKSNIGILWGGAQMKQLSPSLRDSQAAEIAQTIAADVARAYRILPAEVLYAQAAPERFPNLEMYRGVFYTFSLMHRLERISAAFHADDDLFPEKTLEPAFDPTAFIKADTLTMAQAAHNMVQTGSLVPDEERALVFGLPKLPGGQGQYIQETPVGAAPNAAQSAAITQRAIDALLAAKPGPNGHSPAEALP